MPIHNFDKKNIFDSDCEAIVNPVNTVGAMGRGLALQFKKVYPSMYDEYRLMCVDKSFGIGDVHLWFTGETGWAQHIPKYIVNFPTKKDWRDKSEYLFIQVGMDALVDAIIKHDIKSIAIPKLGCGEGGLEWPKVEYIIRAACARIPSVIVHLY